ncbi:hypothetical protein NPIL_454371 [Nephila pilipes]|uniref:Uncharacterized protein n=1 Tax=Nephila pilipes TaxID=299642 RepID=A0A8X6PT05_NEPPI|nr:hypothetical protein NPIL_454371 [Nephila pilipes]
MYRDFISGRAENQKSVLITALESIPIRFSESRHFRKSYIQHAAVRAAHTLLLLKLHVRAPYVHTLLASWLLLLLGWLVIIERCRNAHIRAYEEGGCMHG